MFININARCWAWLPANKSGLLCEERNNRDWHAILGDEQTSRI
jgi:hypothetical protein